MLNESNVYLLIISRRHEVKSKILSLKNEFPVYNFFLEEKYI